VLGDRGARRQLAGEIARAIAEFVEYEALPGLAASDAELAAAYLVHELAAPDPALRGQRRRGGDRLGAARRARGAGRADRVR